MKTRRLRRSMMYVPGSDTRKLEKAAALSLDCAVLDLEDGVAENEKVKARTHIREALGELEFGDTERVVRINPLSHGVFEEEILETIGGAPSGYMLPKIESAADILQVEQVLARAEDKAGISVGETELLVLIESPTAILRMAEIAGASARMSALVFGAEDLASCMGALRTRGAEEVRHARDAIVLHAHAFGLDAIDMVWVDIEDLEGLYEETRFAMQLGYTGKTLIHPSHIEPVERAFTPSDDDFSEAQAILKAFAEHQAKGAGAFRFNGKMIDRAMLGSAERVVQRGLAAGLTE